MSSAEPAIAAEQASSLEPERAPSYRWTICALLFVATTINYIDRQVLGVLAPTLQRALNWSEADYGDIVSWFSFAYGFGFLVAGRVIDRVGVRRGLAGAVIAWSLAAIGHAFARTVAGFSFARALLGVSESAIFPGSIKAIAEWFPQRERALATGIFNAGTNTGAILTPLLVPWIALTWGWQWAFVATGALGLVWLALWIPFYRDVASAQARDEVRPKVSLANLFTRRQTWAFIVGKFMADPVWWFYLYWLPKFLDAKYGVKLAQVAAPLIVVYLIADAGSVGGGWLSSALIKRGWSVNRSRKTAMLAMALLIVPTTLVSRAPTMWSAVGIVGVALAAHQAWSANVYTLASDMFPKFAVGSVVGIGAFGGAMGGVLFQRITGRVLQVNGSDYTPIFLVCGLAYVTAWLIIHLLAPRLEPVRLVAGNR
ncbi:MAG TPA: MFS transporter [Gemmatimonadaceae bacterium]|nr:MFS transporter [Gemmatimonadaceae bacterium]